MHQVHRHRTEMLPTTVFLEMQAGNLAAALAVSLIMVLVTARTMGVRSRG